MPEALSGAEIDDLLAFLRTLTDERYVALMPSDPSKAVTK